MRHRTAAAGRLRRTISLLLAIAILAGAGCGDDDDNDTSADTTPRPQATRESTIVARTPAQRSPSTPAAGEVEVSGVVGAVDTASNTIEITRISGAEVDRIEVGPDTNIRKATGGAATLAQIRPSNRVVATGAVTGNTLIAREITVQDAVPGQAPGG